MPSDAKPQFTPKLRFPEFRKAKGWTEKELRLIADPVTERADNEDENNILTLSGEHGLVLQSEYFGKQIAGTNSDRYIKIQRDDFVYNDRVTKASAYGTIKRLTKQPHGIVSPIYKCFRFKDGEQPIFWEWYFEAGAHELELHGLANEGARAGRFNVSIERFLSTRVRVPVRDEQQKIAECLGTLDELMGAESQKLDALKAHKKGLMQQLFPRAGETRPRLRFPEFQNAPEWGIVSMGELLSRKPEYGVNAPSVPFSESLPTYLRITDIDDDGRFLSESKASVDIIATEENHLSEGDIVLARTGASVGKSYRYQESDGRLVFAGFLIRIRPNAEKVDSMFLFNFLRSDQYWDWVRITSTRSGQPGLNGSEFSSLRVPIPPADQSGMAEQQCIAACLSALDELIAAQSAKLAVLQTHKQGLMQQLFPSPAEAET
ncbi:MAG TPA: restriction endonuclease subunit S [Verrucomicrobiae bacterium]|nr:restriction endonuclease subunit S [Verrucomicrobiae bacterium]